MARTQKNKATMGHLGMLKARIAKLRRELITPKGGGGGAGEGFDVAKTGDARVGFVGELKIPTHSSDREPLTLCFLKGPRWWLAGQTSVKTIRRHIVA
ncbi:unnamed protein product [Toxocara canis]|uniref:DRG2 n=1 Tax=Toxocara canis TaxID=6265 RepID=A0A183UED0_TOXCA|nr:unnamed protein product [Toxocara canis]